MNWNSEKGFGMPTANGAWHGDLLPKGRIEVIRMALRERQTAWHKDLVQRGRIKEKRNHLRGRPRAWHGD